MARGRIILRTISTSDRFCLLSGVDGGEFSQLLYLVSYLHSDDWGHLPYDPAWIRRTCLPDCPRGPQDVADAMARLVAVRLWEYVYAARGALYTHIYRFEESNPEGVRHRRRGEWPAESGHAPKRRPGQDLAASMAEADQVRAAVVKMGPDDVDKHLNKGGGK
jgi:hypothetical protein